MKSTKSTTIDCLLILVFTGCTMCAKRNGLEHSHDGLCYSLSLDYVSTGRNERIPVSCSEEEAATAGSPGWCSEDWQVFELPADRLQLDVSGQCRDARCVTAQPV